MSDLASVNSDQRLYVIHSGYGYTCLGFDVAYDKAREAAEWAQVAAPNPALIGTEEGYLDYRRVMNDAAIYAAETGKRCPIELHPQLMGLEGRRVEVTYPEGRTERFNVGKSTGWMPIHLHIHNRRSRGGHAISPREIYTSVRVVR